LCLAQQRGQREIRTETTLGRTQSTWVELDWVQDAGVTVGLVLVVVVVIAATEASASVVVLKDDVELEPQATTEQQATSTGNNFAMGNLRTRDPLAVVYIARLPRAPRKLNHQQISVTAPAPEAPRACVSYQRL
jgi:hypothetical protein